MQKSKYFIVISIFCLFPLLWSGNMACYDIKAPAVCVSIVALITVLFFLFQQKTIYKGLWYKPSNLFLLSYVIVNFQYIVDLLLGYKNYSFFFYPNTVNRVSFISAIGLVAFALGYFISESCTRDTEISQARSTSEMQTNGTAIIVICQILFFALWIYNIDIASLLSGSSYSEDLDGTAVSSFENLFYCSTLALLVTVSRNNIKQAVGSFRDFAKSIHWSSWIVIILYSGMRFVSGDRGPFIYLLLAILYSYVFSVRKKINVMKLAVMALLLVLVVNVIGIARVSDLSDTFGERFSSAFSELMTTDNSHFTGKTVLPLTEELALSNRCNQIAVNLVDNMERPLHHGKYAIYELLQCIPFMPSVLTKTFGVSIYDISTNILLTDEFVGRHDLSQIGTTIVADSYLDMGLLGVILMLFIIGIIFSRIDFFLFYSKDLSAAKLAFIIVLSSLAVYIPRSTLMLQFKDFIPIMVLYGVNYLITSKR